MDVEEPEERKPVAKGGNRITRELIRKRAEHNESVVSTLEEISLHQEELIAIEEVLGTSCRKLKILYLQNNIISKMEHLHHLKDLEYLNLALNNIAKIEGLHACEFLNKLDLTVNFVDLDALEESVVHLRSRLQLKELYMMGNPAQADWPGFQNYVIASLPQLEMLDGTCVTRSMRIIAEQQLPHLQLELSKLSLARAERRREEGPSLAPIDTEVATPYTPAVRTQMYEEIAEQKKEQEARKDHMKPRERDAKKEQDSAVRKAREKEEREDGKIKQCNEGKWDFFFDEETKKGYTILDVGIARHLDSSLIDLDVHPHYLSVVIKSKTLRLALPSEVVASEAKAQRSKTTGHLLVTMPKLDKNAPPLFSLKEQNKPPKPPSSGAVPANRHRTVEEKPSKSISGLVLNDAASSSMKARETRILNKPPKPPDDDDDDDPPDLV